jgi:hypothetical protein
VNKGSDQRRHRPDRTPPHTGRAFSAEAVVYSPTLRGSRVRPSARRTAEDVGVRRAASSCGAPGCPNVAVHRGRCLEHAPEPWAGSDQSRDRRGVLRGHALQKVRIRRIRAAGGRCQRCGRSDVALVLHHLAELDDYEATLVLCEPCHDREHRHAWIGGNPGRLARRSSQ